MEDMLKDFVVEALDLATNVEELLLKLERQPDDKETLNGVFRSFHTIKGGAGFMSLPAMVSACHLTENLFDALRTGAAPVTPLAIEAALRASGFVADQLTELANGARPEHLSAMPAELEDILKQAIEGKATPAAAPPGVGTAKGTAAANGTGATGVISVISVTNATTMASASGASASVGVDGMLDWAALYRAVVPAAEAPRLTPPVASAPGAAHTETGSAASAAAAAATVRSSSTASADKPLNVPLKEDSIRVDAIKLDALLEVAGESVQAANQASVLLEKLQQFKFEDSAAALMVSLTETLNRASRYSTELQRATLSTRMQPVGRLFQKFPRLVRELAKDLGKDVELMIEGAETEVDRVVVDSLYDPLVHMLRNALDHGIESAAERAALGKPAKAIISLKAWQEANSVMIVLGDDGKGLNATELRNKAIKKGLVNEGAAPTNEEAYLLVFLPGFSTKDVASSVSGRGVGMDVVKTAVEKHRGAISIESTLGAGTQFSIRLPIELSIVPTMLVRTAGAALAMPMAVVQRVVELPETFMQVGGAPVLRDQGRPLPVRSLAGILGYEPTAERVGIVVAAPNPYILAVEKVEGTAEMVIKPLTALSVPGITGTARSAEGELVLVIGLSFLLDSCRPTTRLAA